MQRLPVLIAVLVLAGCATSQRTSFPPPDGPASPQPPAPERPQPQPGDQVGTPAPQTMPARTAAEASSPAVLSLMGRADTLARNGNMDMLPRRWNARSTWNRATPSCISDWPA